METNWTLMSVTCWIFSTALPLFASLASANFGCCDQHVEALRALMRRKHHFWRSTHPLNIPPPCRLEQRLDGNQLGTHNLHRKDFQCSILQSSIPRTCRHHSKCDETHWDMCGNHTRGSWHSTPPVHNPCLHKILVHLSRRENQLDSHNHHRLCSGHNTHLVCIWLNRMFQWMLSGNALGICNLHTTDLAHSIHHWCTLLMCKHLWKSC